MTNENKIKHDFLLDLLGKGDAMVCLDARQPDVQVPKMHKNNPMLNLIFNLNFKRPFDVTEDCISATLAFGGRSHKCFIPFTSVWAIYEPKTQKGQVWETSMPEDIDLSEQIKPTLTGLPWGKGASRRAKTAKKPTAKSPKDRSHLRVIK